MTKQLTWREEISDLWQSWDDEYGVMKSAICERIDQEIQEAEQRGRDMAVDYVKNNQRRFVDDNGTPSDPHCDLDFEEFDKVLQEAREDKK